MANAAHLKALVQSHLEGDEARFFATAMQLAAHETKQGHGKLAQELRGMVDEAKGRIDSTSPCPSAGRAAS